MELSHDFVDHFRRVLGPNSRRCRRKLGFGVGVCNDVGYGVVCIGVVGIGVVIFVVLGVGIGVVSFTVGVSVCFGVGVSV